MYKVTNYPLNYAQSCKLSPKLCTKLQISPKRYILMQKIFYLIVKKYFFAKILKNIYFFVNSIFTFIYVKINGQKVTELTVEVLMHQIENLGDYTTKIKVLEAIYNKVKSWDLAGVLDS